MIVEPLIFIAGSIFSFYIYVLYLVSIKGGG